MKNEFISRELKEIRQDIRELRTEVTRYKGFIGGILWAVAAAFASLQMFIQLFSK